MSRDTLLIDGKMFISSNRASEIAGYSKDYIGQLCREQRLSCTRVGRKWFVEESSLRRHRAETVKANQTSFGAEKAGPAPVKAAKRLRGVSRSSWFVLTAGMATVLVVGLYEAAMMEAMPQAGDQHAAAVEQSGAPAPDVPGYSAEKGGMVVVPSQGSSSDATLARAIQNTFSDQVDVSPNPDGSTGVIKPVFKTVDGHDYLYVMVPVRSSTSTGSSPGAK